MDIDEMSNEAKTTVTSGSSNSVLRLTKLRMTTKVALSNTSRPKYKGVVLQPNGHWGAQIYLKGKREWIGTFESDADAAKAYDIKYIKHLVNDIKSIKNHVNSHRNFPVSEEEMEFIIMQSLESLLNMIREGSYLHVFKKFQDTLLVEVQGRGVDDEGSDMFVSHTQLFLKVLTPSDVGKLNRLVIPKKYAVKYFPEIGGAVEDVEVLFLDTAMRQWKFRYCYWKSSQSFVFTRGWNGFVKEKNLKEGDKVFFYTCNRKTLQGQTEMFSMIDVQKASENGSVVPHKVNQSVHDSSPDQVLETGSVFSSKSEDEKNEGGFMLFGVRIQ